MKYRWNDVDVTEEEYNRRWKEWLEYLKANEEKEEEERRSSRKKISGSKIEKPETGRKNKKLKKRV